MERVPVVQPKEKVSCYLTSHTDNFGDRYYDSLINVMEYLNSLSFTIAKKKQNIFDNFSLSIIYHLRVT